MSISDAMPIRDREEALLEELRGEGKPLKTGVLLDRVLSKLGLCPEEQDRTTPSGYPWWTGCLRLDLNRLREKGLVQRPSWGYWEINSNNDSPTTKSVPDRFTRRIFNILTDLVRGAKSGDIPVLITMREGEFTIKFGKDIEETTIGIAQ